ncbi:iron-siderophore ABC transporter substrate-binding protein [Streptomycetaceae bacterium NBC_01309]
MSRPTSSVPLRGAPLRRKTRFAGVLASAVLVLATAACGSDSDSDADNAAGAAPGGASAASQGANGNPAAAPAYPVTLDHKYGSTTVKGEPKRVVTVGLTDQDALLALGVVPVGTTEWIEGFPGNVGPWAKDKVGSKELPKVLKDPGTGPDFENIAKLQPDLILGLYSGLTEDQYKTLSKIAPTVAQPKGYNDFGIPWQELTKSVGKVLGKSAEADALVKGVEDKFAQAAAAHPEFKDRTALMATVYEGQFVFGSQDPRSRILTSLGFKLPPDLDSVIGDQFGANISPERADLLDRDVMVWTVANVDADRGSLHANKLYSDQNVVKQGREVYILETSDYGSATAFVSPLSLPYVLDRLVPQLVAAVDGDPATEVKPAT